MTEIIAVCIVVILAYVFITEKEKTLAGRMPDFYRKKPMTNIEQALYFRLVTALPDHIVLAQVQVSQIVGIKRGKNTQAWFNKISRKSVDFLICKKDASIVAAIELDDKSHEQPDRVKADADKNTALRAAGITLVRWEARNLPAMDDIQAAITAAGSA